jgi:hypothetical protein
LSCQYWSRAAVGLGEAYSLGPEFAAALAVIAITLTGDPTAGTWSILVIGQLYAPELLDGLLSDPEGISNSYMNTKVMHHQAECFPIQIFSEEFY